MSELPWLVLDQGTYSRFQFEDDARAHAERKASERPGARPALYRLVAVAEAPLPEAKWEAAP